MPVPVFDSWIDSVPDGLGRAVNALSKARST